MRHQVTLCEKMGALGLSGDGGLASLCRAPVEMCVRLPNGLSYEHAALAEPLSVAVRAVRRGRVGLGDRVAVVGGGTIGLFCLQAARNAGASAVYVVEPHAWRRDLALRLGATAVVDPREASVRDQLRTLTGVGPDVVVDASGAVPATLSAIEAARPGGRIVIVALPVASATINFLSIVSTEKEIIGSLSHVYDEDYAAAIQLLADGRVEAEPLISDRIPFEDVLSRGLHRLESQAADTLKILVRPDL
jgi:(R,R)-butanediol dehydrogenase/meso-butanediol dehydrogenase/diacetyl reductase